MRLLSLLGLSLVSVVGLRAETFNVEVGSVTYAIPAGRAGEMVCTSGKSLSILGREYMFADVTRMYVDDSEVNANTVVVTYSGTSARVRVEASVARYVDVAVSGAGVSITQSAEVGDATCGELVYQLSGESDSGFFSLDGSYKSTVRLNGLTLTNPAGPAIDIRNGKRIDLSVAASTVNTLADGPASAGKGALQCKGHLEIKSQGTLNVTGNAAHAIFSKEYLTLKNASVNVLAAVKDGLNCNQYFAMESGALSISNVGDDGIQVSFKDDADRGDDDTGTFTLSGGEISIAATAAAAKAVKADGPVNILGGTLTASVAGTGKWDSTESKTKSAACISSDADVTVSGGVLALTAGGAGGKGIKADGGFNMTDGSLDVSTSGGVFAYVNNREYSDYTGSTDRLGSNYKSTAKGIKVDGTLTIDGGTVRVTTTGNGAEGIESKSDLHVNGGELTVSTCDDGLNSSGHMYLAGGDITVVATDNDGIDSNGNMYISGGTIRTFGARAPECGIDANEEGGFSVVFTGGTLLAVGGSNSVPSTSASTQAYVSGSLSATAGSTVTLNDGSTVLASFVVPDGYSSSSSSSGGPGGWSAPGGWGGGGPGGSQGGGLLISAPGLVSGSSYKIACGSSSATVTARLTGSSR